MNAETVQIKYYIRPPPTKKTKTAAFIHMILEQQMGKIEIHILQREAEFSYFDWLLKWTAIWAITAHDRPQ